MMHFNSTWIETTMDIAGGTLAGGVAEHLMGGDFADGALNGFICAGMNHAMHLLIGNGGKPDDPPGSGSINNNSKNKRISESTKQTITNVGGAGGGVATAVDGAAQKASMKVLSITSKVLGATFVFVSEIPDMITFVNDPSLGNGTKIVVGVVLGVATVVGSPVIATGAFVLGVVNAFGGFDKGYNYLNNIQKNQ